MPIEKLDKILLQVQKPGRYVGNEFGSVHKEKEGKIRFAFCFPDTYEIGMSYLGGRIIYSLLNERNDVWCERVFAPWVDFEEKMRENAIELFALESGDSIKSFDFAAFTLQYEMSYTNIINMLDLAKIPLLSKDRGEEFPLVCAGGPCAYNSEPIADFLDFVMMGEGEILLPAVMDVYKENKEKGGTKQDFLIKIAQIEGIYVPSFYDVCYNDDGTVKSVLPNRDNVPKVIKKVIVEDFDSTFFPKTFIVPNIETVHDRVTIEVFRGCIRGCRFCQAGMIYRPVRAKSVDTLSCQAKQLQEGTGYEEISLLSLSTSDYPQLNELIDKLQSWSEDKHVNLALPSLRLDTLSGELLNKVQKVRKSGLTFAPEAGTQRLRDVINKNISDEEIIRAADIAFGNGYGQLKLYFMIGLPTETMEDVEGIAHTAFEVLARYAKSEVKNKKGVNIGVSVSTFVPKPFTPFQWEGQNTIEQVEEKQAVLREKMRSRKISLSWHDAKTSFLEAVFARGDRRLSKVLIEAQKRGFHFDGWEEYFSYEKWMKLFEDCGIAPSFYANRERNEDEVLPWDHIDVGVTQEFLLRERHQAYKGAVTPDCSKGCAGCGITKIGGGSLCRK